MSGHPLLAATALWLLLPLACKRAPVASGGPGVPASAAATAASADSAAADSVVLERLPGFTRWPGYRVSVARTGRIAFRVLAPGDSARPNTDSVPPARAAALLDAGPRVGVGTLPEIIREHPSLCGLAATDHGTAVVTLFYPNRTATVSDYLGCRDAVPALRAYEAAIDSVAGTERWTPR